MLVTAHKDDSKVRRNPYKVTISLVPYVLHHTSEPNSYMLHICSVKLNTIHIAIMLVTAHKDGSNVRRNQY